MLRALTLSQSASSLESCDVLSRRKTFFIQSFDLLSEGPPRFKKTNWSFFFLVIFGTNPRCLRRLLQNQICCLIFWSKTRIYQVYLYINIYFSYVCPDPPDLLPIFFFSLSLSYLLTNLLLSISFESINVLLPPFVGGKLVLGCDGVHNILYWTARAALVWLLARLLFHQLPWWNCFKFKGSFSSR